MPMPASEHESPTSISLLLQYQHCKLSTHLSHRLHGAITDLWSAIAPRGISALVVIALVAIMMVSI